ncbi:uncharacterized protein LOC132190566 [Corylus avellana]|uniref:uncharacterized protein LOC132190566 n=1 Tax=Corylus avellana TaxID=13451 RepID=UPI00286CFCA9|nr:uncharacterized protein LOC132190566 [Corylus avellana]
MDKKLGKHNIEYIKRTMQMHEDVFKYQVRELHRLYSLQKMVMDELKKELKQNRCWSSMTPTTQKCHGFNFNLQSLREDPSTRERSGSCSAGTMRMARGFDLERPAAEEDISTGVSAAIDEDQAVGPSFHNMPPSTRKLTIDGSDHEDSDVELTLSIGGRLSNKALQSYQPILGICESSSHKGIIRELHSSASFKSDRGEDFSDPTTPMSSSSATFDQERNRPHWLFQDLKLE